MSVSCETCWLLPPQAHAGASKIRMQSFLRYMQLNQTRLQAHTTYSASSASAAERACCFGFEWSLCERDVPAAATYRKVSALYAGFAERKNHFLVFPGIFHEKKFNQPFVNTALPHLLSQSESCLKACIGRVNFCNPLLPSPTGNGCVTRFYSKNPTPPGAAQAANLGTIDNGSPAGGGRKGGCFGVR